MKIGTDVAASEFYEADKKIYNLDWKNPDQTSVDPSQRMDSSQLIEYYKAQWLNKYPFVSIEDPFDQVGAAGSLWGMFRGGGSSYGGQVGLELEEKMIPCPHF